MAYNETLLKGTAMRKTRRTLQLSFVKTPVAQTAAQAPEPVADLDPEVINKIAKEQIYNIAVATGATILATMLAGAVKDVAVHTAKTHIK